MTGFGVFAIGFVVKKSIQSVCAFKNIPAYWKDI